MNLTATARTPVTSGPDWKASQPLPADLPAPGSATYRPGAADQFLPRGMSLRDGELYAAGRTGARGEFGTEHLVLLTNTTSTRPGASLEEGPLLVIKGDTPAATLKQALAAAKLIAQAADAADPTNTKSMFHSVAIVQASFGHLALIPTGRTEMSTDYASPTTPFVMTHGAGAETVVRPTDRTILAVANATDWIDLRG